MRQRIVNKQLKRNRMFTTWWIWSTDHPFVENCPQASLKLQHREERDTCRLDLSTCPLYFIIWHTQTFLQHPLPWFWVACWVSGTTQVSWGEQACWVLVTWGKDGPAERFPRSPQEPGRQEFRPTYNASSSARPNAFALSPNDFLIPAPSPEGREITREVIYPSYLVQFNLITFHVKSVAPQVHLCEMGKYPKSLL